MAQNLNLFTHYDKSLAEISSELHDTSIKKKLAKKSLGKRPPIAIILVSSTVCILFLYVLISYLVNIRGQTIDTGIDLAAHLHSSEEQLGYVKIQVFEFADETNQPTDNKSIAVAIENVAAVQPQESIERENAYTSKDKILSAITDNKPSQQAEIAKTTPAKKAEPAKKSASVATPTPAKKTEPVKAAPVVASKEYYLLFEGLNSDEYNNIKKINLNFNMTNNIISTIGTIDVIWKVYEITDSGDITLSGNKVKYVNEFTNKDDAINFAKSEKIQSVIKAEDIDNRLHTVQFCCTDIDKAKEFAIDSKITDKVIKIVRSK